MKPVRSPIAPLIIGIVLLVPGAFFAWSIIAKIGSGLSGLTIAKGIGLPVVVLLVAAVLISIGISLIGPRRRYLATTTPEQREADKVAERKRRGNIGGPVDYGTRVDAPLGEDGKPPASL